MLLPKQPTKMGGEYSQINSNYGRQVLRCGSEKWEYMEEILELICLVFYF